jgi:hypothetical protein
MNKISFYNIYEARQVVHIELFLGVNDTLKCSIGIIQQSLNLGGAFRGPDVLSQLNLNRWKYEQY